MKHSAVTKSDLDRLRETRHHDPGLILGKHVKGSVETARSLVPGAKKVSIAEPRLPMTRIEGTDIFEWSGPCNSIPDRFQVLWHDNENHRHIQYEPYCFPPRISDYDLHLFNEGSHLQAYKFLGANRETIGGIEGVLFATWAPAAERVSVIGDFNQWDGRRHPMRVRGSSGVWELFIPGICSAVWWRWEGFLLGPKAYGMT